MPKTSLVIADQEKKIQKKKAQINTGVESNAHEKAIESATFCSDKKLQRLMLESAIMDSTYNKLTTESIFTVQQTNDHVIIRTGCLNDHQEEILFFLTQQDNRLILSDNGSTRAYLDKIYELSESDVIKNIMSAASYYGISTENKQLSIAIEETECGLSHAICRMLNCTQFYDTMKIFYL